MEDRGIGIDALSRIGRLVQAKVSRARFST